MIDRKDIPDLVGEWCRVTALGFLLRSWAMHMAKVVDSEKEGKSRRVD